MSSRDATLKSDAATAQHSVSSNKPSTDSTVNRRRHIYLQKQHKTFSVLRPNRSEKWEIAHRRRVERSLLTTFSQEETAARLLGSRSARINWCTFVWLQLQWTTSLNVPFLHHQTYWRSFWESEWNTVPPPRRLKVIPGAREDCEHWSHLNPAESVSDTLPAS